MPLQEGLVQVYTGDGKGKTTAALGLALRASGQGLRVHIVQFMKGWAHYGELTALAALPNITLRRFGRPQWIDPTNIQPEDLRLAREALAHSRETVQSGQYDVVILNEANLALAWGLIPLEEVRPMIERRPPRVELVFTGRSAPAELIELADLVTQMQEVKHPYQRGLTSRRGIDF